MSPADIKSMDRGRLREELTQRGYPAFRADQIGSWLDRGVTDFEQMTNLPAALRRELREQFCIPAVSIRRKLVSALDGTIKYLFGLSDGETVESVLMQYHHGWSQCLSTQVGCRMGCTFCATGMGGLVRNLEPSEMLSQIEAAQADAGVRVSSIVLMGMGEPLDNFDNVLRFLEMLSEPGGVHIGMRHVSLSTCGLIDGVNDSDACAIELAARLKGMLCHVNLIPVNEVAGKRQRRSGAERLRRFSAILADRGIPVTTRRTLGADINASCGQLRREADQTPD